MDFNKMTGEPNQQNPTSVFGFDSYPPPFEVSWNQTNPFARPMPQYNTEANQESHLFGHDPGLTFPTSMNMPTSASGSVPLENNYSFEKYSGFSFSAPKPTQEVVHFPFETYTGFGTREIRCKRKTDSPPLQPSKQHITEEKMAEHMSKLHISSETVSSKETDSTRMQRLYMCEEMRKLQTDSILPHSLLSQMQGPCTALVLWKPPTKLINILDGSTEVDQNSKRNARESLDRNKSDETSSEAEMNEAPINNMDLDTC